MATVGEILKTRRNEKKFGLDDVHKFVKIHPKFLTALEEGNYEVFSDKIHATGFLKNYSDFLGLDAEKLLGLWRREYEAYFDNKSKDRENNVKKVMPQKFLITPGLVLSIISVVLIVLFFGYLTYQYQTFSGAPVLEIYSPQNSIVVNSEILDVTGKTDRDAILLINNQRVLTESDGSFITSIKLREGLNTLTFLAVNNKLNRETEEIRTIIYRRLEEVPFAPETTESTVSEVETSEELDSDLTT